MRSMRRGRSGDGTRQDHRAAERSQDAKERGQWGDGSEAGRHDTFIRRSRRSVVGYVAESSSHPVPRDSFAPDWAWWRPRPPPVLPSWSPCTALHFGTVPSLATPRSDGNEKATFASWWRTQACRFARPMATAASDCACKRIWEAYPSRIGSRVSGHSVRAK